MFKTTFSMWKWSTSGNWANGMCKCHDIFEILKTIHMADLWTAVVLLQNVLKSMKYRMKETKYIELKVHDYVRYLSSYCLLSNLSFPLFLVSCLFGSKVMSWEVKCIPLPVRKMLRAFQNSIQDLWPKNVCLATYELAFSPLFIWSMVCRLNLYELL